MLRGLVILSLLGGIIVGLKTKKKADIDSVNSYQVFIYFFLVKSMTCFIVLWPHLSPVFLNRRNSHKPATIYRYQVISKKITIDMFF